MIVRGVVSYFLRLAHLKPLNLGFSEMPLVSISNGQRRPIAKANFVATVHQRHSHELAHANRRGGYVAFLRRIRASTARHPIKPTCCPSAWQPNPGRRSTYRRGKTVQTIGATSLFVLGHNSLS